MISIVFLFSIAFFCFMNAIIGIVFKKIHFSGKLVKTLHNESNDESNKELIKKYLKIKRTLGIVAILAFVFLVTAKCNCTTTDEVVDEYVIDTTEMNIVLKDNISVENNVSCMNGTKIKIEKHRITKDVNLNKNLVCILFFKTFRSDKYVYEISEYK